MVSFSKYKVIILVCLTRFNIAVISLAQEETIPPTLNFQFIFIGSKIYMHGVLALLSGRNTENLPELDL